MVDQLDRVGHQVRVIDDLRVISVITDREPDRIPCRDTDGPLRRQPARRSGPLVPYDPSRGARAEDGQAEHGDPYEPRTACRTLTCRVLTNVFPIGGLHGDAPRHGGPRSAAPQVSTRWCPSHENLQAIDPWQTLA